jgi:DNA-binding transcriptional MocR family regulator
MDKSKANSKINQVIHHLQQLILNQPLLMGSRLPSIRQLATQLNLSTSTVVEAYERLVSTGEVQARAGAGYFVAEQRASSYVAQILEPKLIERDIDPLWISRQALAATPNSLKPGCGWLPYSWLPVQIVRKAIKDAAQSHEEDLVDYPEPLGYLPLRQLISRKVKLLEISAQPEQILISDSGSQALDLVLRLILQAGDCVLMDDPGFFNFRALLKLLKIQVIAIPYTSQGPDVAAFEQAAKRYHPKVYLTNAALHNPTGAVLSPATAYQILKIVEQQQMLIVEDDIFADFETVPATRYAALGGFEQVIQVASFSKTISAAIRCGYVIASPQRIELLINLKIATSFSHNFLNSKIIYLCLSNSQYRKHLEQMRIKLAQAMSRTLKQLQQLDIQPWLIPQAGMFLWCQLRPEIDTAALCQTCLIQGVVLAPGNSFSPSKRAQQFLRFNVAQCSDAKIFEVLRYALDLQKASSPTQH